MSEKQVYQVEFSGEVIPGHTESEVEDKLIGKLKIPPEKVNRLFSGETHVLKRNLDYQSARNFQNKFEELGALCHVKKKVPAEDSAPQKPIEQEVTTPTLAIREEVFCPNCQGKFEVDSSPTGKNKVDDCPRCGVVLSKFHKKLTEEYNVKFSRDVDETAKPAPIKRRIMAVFFTRGLILCWTVLFVIPIILISYFFFDMQDPKTVLRVQIALVVLSFLIFYFMEVRVPLKEGATSGQKFANIKVVDSLSEDEPTHLQWILRLIGIGIADSTANLLNIHMIFQEFPRSFADWISRTEQYETNSESPQFKDSLIPLGIGFILMFGLVFVGLNIFFPTLLGISTEAKDYFEKEGHADELETLINCQKAFAEKHGTFSYSANELIQFCEKISTEANLIGLNYSFNIIPNKEGYIIELRNEYMDQDKEKIDPLKLFFECEKTYYEMYNTYTPDPEELLLACFLSPGLQQIAESKLEKDLVEISAGKEDFHITLHRRYGKSRTITETGEIQ